jgi:hypothetical protein
MKAIFVSFIALTLCGIAFDAQAQLNTRSSGMNSFGSSGLGNTGMGSSGLGMGTSGLGMNSSSLGMGSMGMGTNSLGMGNSGMGMNNRTGTSNGFIGANNNGQFIGANSNTNSQGMYSGMNRNSSNMGMFGSQNRSGFGMNGSGMNGFGMNGFGMNNQNQRRQMATALKIDFPVPARSSAAVNSTLGRRLEEMVASRGMPSVKASMQGRTLVLRGKVATEHDKSLVERMMLLEPGIDQVQNELEIGSADSPEPKNSAS